MRIKPTPSWILFLGSLGVGFGIAIGSWGWIVVIVIAIGFIPAWFWMKTVPMRDRAMLLGICFLGMTIGFSRYAMTGPGSNSVAHLVGRSATVEGRIIDADLTDYGVTYGIDSLVIDDIARDDRVRVEAPISATHIVGDHIRAQCDLAQPEPFDGFRYDRFLAAKSIYVICRLDVAPFSIPVDNPSLSDRFWIMIGSIHGWVEHRARSILPEPQATLLLGLLIGEDSFSSEWRDAFRHTGTSHIVAASGYNVAVVAELAMLFFVTIGLYRKQAYPIVIGCILIFTIIAGAGGAVIRAAIMGILVLTARHIGRRASPRNIVMLTIAGMLLFEPRLLRDDVGFQLSVMATIGLIVLTDRIASVLKNVPTAFGVRESLASTIAATIATLPITVVSFGMVSVVAPFVNMLVLPFIPYAMAFGGGAIAVSSLIPQIGVWIALPVWTMLSTMTSMIDIAATLPFASFSLSPRVAILCTVLAIGLAVAIARWIPRSFERNLDAWNLRRASLVSAIVCGLFVIQIGAIIWRSGRLNSASTHVFVFDVGQGDGIFIDGKDKDVVIDGGPTRFGFVEQMSHVRFPWERNIDIVLATHPHADHIVGLFSLFQTHACGEVVMNGSVYSAPAAEAFTSMVPNALIAHTSMNSWVLGSDASLEILLPADEGSDVHSDNVHDRGIVARLTIGEQTMLFMGDAEHESEVLLGDIGQIDILKVGHHGSDTSTGEAFLQMIDPEFAVISVGEKNRYGHPTAFVLARLAEQGIMTLRTDINGTIRFDLDQNAIDWYSFGNN